MFWRFGIIVNFHRYLNTLLAGVKIQSKEPEWDYLCSFIDFYSFQSSCTSILIKLLVLGCTFSFLKFCWWMFLFLLWIPIAARSIQLRLSSECRCNQHAQLDFAALKENPDIFRSELTESNRKLINLPLQTYWHGSN